MSVRLPLLALLVAAAAVLALACAGGGPGEPTPTPEPSPTPVPTAAPFPTPDVGDVPLETPSDFLDLAAEPPLLTIAAADGGDLQTGGRSLARGDFNGDGLDDLLLGAPFADGPDNARTDAGEAYVFFGPLAAGEIDLAREAPDLTIYGALPGDNLGFSVIGGDLNGDGVDDVIVGAPGSNGLRNIRTDLGEAYVIFGGPGLGGTVDIARIEQDATVRAAEGFARLGTSFAVGDVNGDGIDDLIAGAPFAGRAEGSPPGSPRTTEGEVYVVFGRVDLSGEVDVARGQQDLRFKGAQELDSFGQAVAVADVNGDGALDIVITARRADGPEDSRQDAGEAYIFFGPFAAAERIDSAQADVTIYGAEAGDTLGDLAAAGDLNGDGLSDIILSARFAAGRDNLRPTGGEAYVILGSPSLPPVIDLAQGGTGAVLYGRRGADMFPSAAAVADLDGDGAAEAVLAASFADGPEGARPDGGEVYVIAGSRLAGELDLRSDVGAAIFVYGAANREQLGLAVLAIDIDGDGGPELALLAPGPPQENGAPGRVYVVEPLLP